MSKRGILAASAVAAVAVAPAIAIRVAQTSAQYCGVERAAVKHLTDGFVPSGPPVVMTIPQLVGMSAPPVTSSSPRLPQEQTLVELDGVHLIAAKQESDSDLHLIIATTTGAELNVEAPMAVCDAASPWAAQLASARAAADATLGQVSSSNYTAENLTVTVEGLLFFDVLHGQRGAANGVELHPLTYFAVGSSPTPPPMVTTPAVTTPNGDDAVDELPGCVQHPERIYMNGRKQNHCAATFFVTP